MLVIINKRAHVHKLKGFMSKYLSKNLSKNCEIFNPPYLKIIVINANGTAWSKFGFNNVNHHKLKGLMSIS